MIPSTIDYLNANEEAIEGKKVTINDEVYEFSNGSWRKKLMTLSLENDSLIANSCGCEGCGCS